jgi:hypothetical protein
LYDGTAPAPTRYGILIAIMREFGWSWDDVNAAPADLVEEIATRLEAEREYTEERRKRDAAMKAQGF